MIRTVISAVALVLLTVCAAQASDAPLTEDQAKRFVKTLPALEKFGEELEAEGKTENLQVEAQPKAGEDFKPYSKAVAVLKKSQPADHAKLQGLVKPHGFSAAEWGDVGDKVMIAYMAVRMEEEDPRAMAMMEGMDKSMMDMMPPEMKSQMESAFAMMETVRKAPEADKQAIAVVKNDLDKHFEAME